jgi:ribonucleotide reductase beta subunit family protein with ferritin-like domain
MYKKLVENFWSTTENIGNLDALHLNENETKFLKLMCSFYATLDQSCGIVSENFAEEFSKLIQITEAKFYYGHQLFVQNIHFEMYNKLFETLLKSDTERNELYLTMETKKSTINKRNWVKKWSEQSVSFADKLVASVCMHGLFFSTINLIQQWLKERSGSGFLTTATSYNHEFIEIIDKMVIDEVNLS